MFSALHYRKIVYLTFKVSIKMIINFYDWTECKIFG